MGRHIVRGTIPWQAQKWKTAQAAPAKAKRCPRRCAAVGATHALNSEPRNRLPDHGTSHGSPLTDAAARLGAPPGGREPEIRRAGRSPLPPAAPVSYTHLTLPTICSV